jgi:hypothetical protein
MVDVAVMASSWGTLDMKGAQVGHRADQETRLQVVQEVGADPSESHHESMNPPGITGQAWIIGSGRYIADSSGNAS